VSYLYKNFDLTFFTLPAFVVNPLLILKKTTLITKNTKENPSIKNIFLKKYNI